MRRLSVRSLMAFILVAAIGLAALRNPSDLWAAVMLLVALVAVGIAVLGAVILRGRERCWSLGFALFSGGYLALIFGPGFLTEVTLRPVTTSALGFVHSLVAAGSEGELRQILWWQHAQLMTRVDRLTADGRGPGDREFDSAMRMIASLETQLPGAVNYRDFIRIGQCLLALLSGLLGGTVATRFYAWRERREAF